MAKTFAEIAQDKIGTVYLDKFDEGVRFIILRGPNSLCGYLGIPTDHPLANRDYESIPVTAHGGLTFSKAGNGEYLPANTYWYGWDYAHAGDRCFYDLKYPSHIQEKEWTVELVESDSWQTLYEFGKVMRLAESVANKARGEA